jgi:hypothetical protein
MTVTFTLSPIYTGATYVAGPFNIFAVTNTGSSTQVGTGITKAQLATGHTISGISDATTGGTITSTGTCTNSYPWYVSTPEPTPTATESVTLNSYANSGRGNNPASACGDSRTLWSNCSPFDTFGPSCIVYEDSAGNIPLLGFNYVHINGATYDMNSSTGAILFPSSEQC